MKPSPFEWRALRLAKKIAAGVGATMQSDALSGRLTGLLGASLARPLDWRLVARTGITTREALALLEETPADPFDVAVVALGVNDVTAVRLVPRWLDDVERLKGARIHLVAHLQAVAPVHEYRGALAQDDREAGGAREAGEPGEPFGVRRRIFVLVLVRARHDEAMQVAARQLRAQRLQPRGAVGGIGRLREGLEAALEGHLRRQGCGAPPPTRISRVAHPSRSMRRASVKPSAP